MLQVKLKQFAILVSILVALSAIYLLSDYLTLAYNISGKAIIYPYQEWTLTKTRDGNIAINLKNNFNNSLSQFSSTEFQRGDNAEFNLADGIFERGWINKGDTIGYISSNIETSRLIEYEGELKVQRKLLVFYATGEKPQEVQAAYERKILAQQVYETQKRISDRNSTLFEQSLISEEEYEISQNLSKVKLYNFNIASSEYDAIISGSKSEQLDYVMAQISALESQITQVKQLLNSFTIQSPFSGQIVRERSVFMTDQSLADEVILKLVDNSKFLALIPIDLFHTKFLEIGHPVSLRHPSERKLITATIIGFDNNIHMIQQRQKVLVNAVIESDLEYMLPNMHCEVKINTGKITVKEYASRLFKQIYNN